MLPLVIKNRRLGRFANRRRLQPAGAPLTDYCMPAYSGDPRAIALGIVEGCLELRDTWDELWFSQWQKEDPLTRAVKEHPRESGYELIERETAGCPYVALSGTFEEYMKTRSKSVRQSHRTALSKIRKEGLRLELTSHLTLSRELYEDIVHISEEKAHGSLMDDPRVKDFFRALLQEKTRDPGLEVWLATLDGQPAAIAFVSIDTKRRYCWTVGAGHLGRQYSVGNLLLHHLLERGYAEGLEEFDFLRGDEPYKLRWASEYRELTCFGVMGRQAYHRFVLAPALALQGVASRIRHASRSDALR